MPLFVIAGMRCIRTTLSIRPAVTALEELKKEVVSYQGPLLISLGGGTSRSREDKKETEKEIGRVSEAIVYMFTESVFYRFLYNEKFISTA